MSNLQFARISAGIQENFSLWKGAKLLPSFSVFGIGILFWMMNPPTGLTLQAWHLFVIFVCTILAVILKPLPMGAVALVSLALCTGTGTLKIEQALSTFGSHVVWLVVLAFFLARGFIKTGLGTRIAYGFISILGKSALGLSYGFVLTEFLLAPFVPSNTARGAGIVYPIVSSLAAEQGSHPDRGTQRDLGAFLIKVAFHTNAITSAMFLTALVGNPLIASFAGSAGVEITWMSWAVAAFLPGIVNLIMLPLFLYKIYPPHLKASPEAARLAKERLKEMGPLKQEESLMLVTFLGILGLWIFGHHLGVDPTTAALIGFAVLLLTGVLNWQDVLQEKGAWETFIWFAPLLMMATFLTKFGMTEWFSTHMQGMVSGQGWITALLVLCFVYFYAHYFFASVTAHITALYSAFLVVLLALGTPPMVAAMSLAVLSSLSGPLTHFGTGTAPVFFGAGYLAVSDWWRLSFFVSLLNLSVWTVIGGLWWKILGYW